ncbi:MAG: purine-binding chemotaxis protein [Methanoregula sp. PtaU1.Bin051]|nr:MAG: purine-binding chemotaxis protein [Methanoregula sp. PtaU1.Bin051]
MTSLLSFSIDGIQCAVPLADVERVVRMVQLTPLHNAGPGQAGTINLHGRTVIVYSMRHFFQCETRPPKLTDVLIIGKSGVDCVALWVDKTSGVQEIPDIPPQTDKRAGSAVMGVVTGSDGTVIIPSLADFLQKADPAHLRALIRPGPTPKDVTADDTGDLPAVLFKRTKKLARPVDDLQVTALIDLLKFRLMYQEYALSMKYIREVVLTGGITPVPGTPDYISGICAIRGEIVSLVDLQVLFSLKGKGLTDLNRVIVLTDGTITFGILADSITGMVTIPESRIGPSDGQKTLIDPMYVLGFVDDLIVLDAGAILANPKMVVDDSTA